MITREFKTTGRIVSRWIPLILGVVGVVFQIFQGRTTAQDDGFVAPETQLQALKPEEPESYRDLAEELSVVENSTLAKQLTIRLYLISAINSSGKLKRSSLRGLIRSARNEEELRRFKALAYLQDAQFSSLFYDDEQNAQGGEEKNAGGKRVGPDQPSKKMLDALRSLRQGKSRRAKKIMEDDSVRIEFAKYQDILGVDEFSAACDSGQVSDTLLLKILELDSVVRNGRKPTSTTGKDPDSAWRFIFKNRIPPRVPKIDYDSVSEFDPANSVFRNGVWRKPSKN